jgi:hypothetical protein
LHDANWGGRSSNEHRRDGGESPVGRRGEEMSDPNYAMRELYFEEMDTDMKIEKMAVAIEHLARHVVQQEKTIAKLMQHEHTDGQRLYVPIVSNEPELPWFMTHILNRAPK